MRQLVILLFAPLSIFCQNPSAEVDDLLRDSNITWVAETYVDFFTEDYIQDKLDTFATGILPLKFYNPSEEDISEDYVLQKFIFDAVRKGLIPIYKDKDCQKLTTYKEIDEKDSDLNIDPTTYETRLGIRYSPNENDIDVFRARQIVFYDSARAQFGLRTISVGIMLKDYLGDTRTGWKPYFWIKAEDLTQKRNLADTSIWWAKRLSQLKGIAPTKDLNLKILKATHADMPLLHFWKAFENNPKIDFYKVEYGAIKTKFTAAERAKARIRTDTIVVIDPETYESETKIHLDTLQFADLPALQFRQNWYWDNEKKQLQIWLLATALLKNVKNEADEFLYRQPIFYRRTDD